MSRFAGVQWYGGRPAVLADAWLLAERLRGARDRPECAVVGSAAVAAVGCCLTESSSTPSRARALRRVVVALNGWIHNRTQLARELNLHPDASDSSIVEHAWYRWGRDTAARLVGDFALTLIDQDRVFAARDCGPFRPLFYRPSSSGCEWASELPPLVRHDRPPPNEGVVAEYLADRVVALAETLYEGVYRLPPGHALEVTRDGRVEVWPYWTPDPGFEIRYRDQREYDEHFRMLFREAVACRIRAGRRIAVWYSGGVDSSAVVAQLAELRDSGASPVPADIETISIAAHGYAVDETPFFSAGAVYFGLPNVVRPFHFGSDADFEQASAHSCDAPPVPSMMGATRGWEALVQRGVDACLTGFGGDDWFIGSQFALLDDIRALRWRSAAARWRAERRLPFGFSATHLLRLGVWLHLPAPGRALVRRAFGFKATPAHVSPDLAARVDLEDRLRATRPAPAFASLAQRTLYEAATGASVAVTGEVYASQASRWRIDTRHPFEDRRLMEFALALPPDQLLRPGMPRHIVLSAMLGDVPRALYNRTDGVDYSPVMRDLLLRLGGRNRVDAALAELPDWLDPTRVRQMADDVEQRNAVDVVRQMWGLWQIIAIHTWWKTMLRPVETVAPLPGQELRVESVGASGVPASGAPVARC